MRRVILVEKEQEREKQDGAQQSQYKWVSQRSTSSKNKQRQPHLPCTTSCYLLRLLALGFAAGAFLLPFDLEALGAGVPLAILSCSL